MHLRLIEILKKSHIVDNQLIDKYRYEIIEKAQVFHSLCIKYNLIHAKDVIIHAYEVLRKINKTEPLILKDVIELLI